MRITESADWRDALPFESPVLLADVVPGEPARCAGCGPDVEPRPRDELWAYKHRHPNNHAGYVRFYCAVHVPAARRAPVSPSSPVRRERARSAPRASSPARRSPDRDATRAMCPDCFIEVASNGICGVCGRQVA